MATPLPHQHALAAPAVTGHDDVLAGHDEVGGTVDAVPDALSGAVAVVEKVLACGIVHLHHREAERSGAVHGFQAQDAGGGFLAAPDYA